MSELDEPESTEEQKIQPIVIDGIVYNHVKTREYTPVSIFKGDGQFLRIGPEELIAPELDLHKKLLGYGFPVPAVLSEGEQEDNFYYIEKSLGDDLLGDVFWEDCKKEGKISNEHFADLLNLTEKFAKAQLKTATNIKDDESFYLGILMDYIQDELPELKGDLMAAFEKLKRRTSDLPTVLSHGDFNAYNLFKDGVIDFGNIHNAPAGYDLVGNIYHTYNFPKAGDYESSRRYEFTADQISQYFDLMDKIFAEAGLPKLSNFREDFIWAKEVWATTRMENFPKLQKWRYDKFKKILIKYINDEPIMQTALEF